MISRFAGALLLLLWGAGGAGCGCAPASLRRVGYYLAVAVKEDV